MSDERSGQGHHKEDAQPPVDEACGTRALTQTTHLSGASATFRFHLFACQESRVLIWSITKYIVLFVLILIECNKIRFRADERLLSYLLEVHSIRIPGNSRKFPIPARIATTAVEFCHAWMAAQFLSCLGIPILPYERAQHNRGMIAQTTWQRT